MERTFQLDEVDSLISRLKQLNLDVIAPKGESLGGGNVFHRPKANAALRVFLPKGKEPVTGA